MSGALRRISAVLVPGVTAAWDGPWGVPPDPVQAGIREKIETEWVFMSEDELRSLQGQCAVIGHEWPMLYRASHADPLSQRPILAPVGTPCFYCRSRKP